MLLLFLKNVVNAKCYLQIVFSLVPGYLGSWVPGFLGSWVPGHLGTRVPGFLGSWVPGFLGTIFSQLWLMTFISSCRNKMLFFRIENGPIFIIIQFTLYKFIQDFFIPLGLNLVDKQVQIFIINQTIYSNSFCFHTLCWT